MRASSPPFRPSFARRSLRSSRLALLLLALGCRPGPLSTGATSADVADRARLLRIEDTRRDERAFLDSALAATSPVTRAAAALTAGRIGGVAHRDRLRALVADSDPRIAANALFALAMLKDSASVPLAARALHRDVVVAEQGAWLLGEVGDAGRASLVAALADSAIAPATRGALLLAATRLRPVPAAAVVPWLASADSAIGWRAAYALSRGRSAAGVRPLLAAARSPWASVRENAARGLGRTLAGDSLADPAIAALRALAGDTSAHVRVNAVRALASYAARSRADVVRALRDGDPAVRLTAAQALDAVLDSAAATWRDAMRADTSLVVQRAVAEGAVRHASRDVVPAEWRASDDWQRRAAVAELDALGPASAALPRTLTWLRDPDGRVRAAAAGGVARLADSAATRMEARRALRNALRDADPQVRTAALGALAKGADAGDVALALTSYQQSLADRDNDARLAFWTFADSAQRRAIALPDSTSRRLSAIARPADPLERIAAARTARFASWADSAGSPRPLAWYEARAREALAPGVRRAVIETDRGTLELDLFGSDAPLTVYNFISLASTGYFDGQRFHRVVPNFVVQGGDPRGDGNGGPGYAIRDEINPRRYLRGTLGMALSGPHTGGSQFFVTHSPQPHLDGGYTVFGQLRSGGDALDRIVQGDRIVRVTIR